jgi:hypothetical protein
MVPFPLGISHCLVPRKARRSQNRRAVDGKAGFLVALSVTVRTASVKDNLGRATCIQSGGVEVVIEGAAKQPPVRWPSRPS